MSTSKRFTTREFADVHPTVEPRRSRRTWWILGSIVLVLVVILIPGAILMATGGGSDSQDSGPNAANSPENAGPDFGHLRWQQVSRAQLPFSSTAGPSVLDGVAARGFAHTRAGAIVAAWQIPIRLAVLSEGTESIYAKQVIGTANDIDQLRASMDSLQRSYATDQTLPRVIAWREHLPYNDDVASYDFAVPDEVDTAVRLVRFSVVWVKGDWRYQPGLYGAATGGPVDARSVNPGNGWTHFPEGEQ